MRSGTTGTASTYEPFGATVSTGAASSNPFFFTGREQDASGLSYYRARYYSPTFQRFLGEDPLTLSFSFGAREEVAERSASGELSDEDLITLLMHSTILSNPILQHPYLYGQDNPLRFTDPSGEFVPQAIGCAIGAGVSVGLDVYSHRKINLLHAGLGCALGAGTGYLASIANANRHLRVGFGRHGGDRVFRIAGEWVQAVFGKRHIDFWRGGPL